MGIKIKIDGVVDTVGEVTEFASGFRKCEVVIETAKDSNYPCPIACTFKKDDCEKVANLKAGDIAHIEGFLGGRRWDGPNGTKFFLEIDAKSIIIEKTTAEESPAECTWDAVREEYAAVNKCEIADLKKGGSSFKTFVDFCKNAANGKALKDFTDADRALVIKALAADDLADDPDDMPF